MVDNKEKQNIPEGWVSKSVSNLCDNLDNKRVPVTKADRVSGDIPYYGATGIIDYVDNYIFDDEILLIGEDGADWSAFANTSFLVSGKSWVNNHAHVLKCKDGVMSPYLKEYFNWKNLDCYTTGGTRKKLNKEALMNIPVVLPESKKEQQKIAEVLGAVDEEIEKTTEVIRATEKLKKGLMQQLFTRGIGHTKFKQTELGEIPEGWQIGGFEKLVDPENKNAIKPGPFGSVLKKEFYVLDGYKIYGQEQVLNNDPYYGDYYISEEKYKSLEAFKVAPKDLLISLVGTIGKTLIVPEDAKPGIINPRLLKVTLDHKNADVRFVDYLLHSPVLINQMVSRSHGGTMSILNKGMLLSVNFPIPPKREQEEITKILSAVDEKITVNKKLLAKQTELKKGLMQDLLSGVKRVEI